MVITFTKKDLEDIQNEIYDGLGYGDIKLTIDKKTFMLKVSETLEEFSDSIEDADEEFKLMLGAMLCEFCGELTHKIFE